MRRGQIQLDRQASGVDTFGELRSDYAMSKRSPYRRRRTGTLPYGTHADWHYRVEVSFTDSREQARDYYRNDAVVGSIVDRAVTNTLMDGIDPDPNTGDAGVNADLSARWTAWSEDAEACDQAGEHAFRSRERFALSQMLVDGDICDVALQSGQLAMMEAHRLRTPTNTKKNVVHGVLLDDNRRRLEYWFTKEDIDAYTSLERVSDITPVPVRDDDGHRQLFHLYDPARVSQTRGVTAFARIFDRVGMVEDIDFATMVKQQVASCFTIFRSREIGFAGDAPAPTGAEHVVPSIDGSGRTVEGIAPGMQVTGKPGETLTGFSPNIPNTEFFEHLKLILTIIGINLGMPLVMVLMDASETTFSGYRGAIDQARIGFRRNQRLMVGRYHAPIYRWKVRQWMVDDPALRNFAAKNPEKVFGCKWHLPSWPYIEPVKDSQADAQRARTCQASQRRIQAERGRDWNDVYPEIIADNGDAIEAAIVRAQKINLKLQAAQMPPLHWRELLPLPMPEGITERLTGTDVSATEGANDSAGAADDDAPPAKKKSGKKKPAALSSLEFMR